MRVTNLEISCSLQTSREWPAVAQISVWTPFVCNCTRHERQSAQQTFSHIAIHRCSFISPIENATKRTVYCMNSSRADSRVNCLKTSDVSETHPVSILRESDFTFPEDGDWVSLKRRRLFPKDEDWVCLWNVGGSSLRMETECVSETSEDFP
jgi:hypothetical protein